MVCLMYVCSKRRKRTYYYYYTLFSVYEKTSGFFFCVSACVMYYYTDFVPRFLSVCGCTSACYTHSEFHGVPNPLRRRCLSVVSGSSFFSFIYFFFTLTPILYTHATATTTATTAGCVRGFAPNVWTQNRRWSAPFEPWNVRGSHTRGDQNSRLCLAVVVTNAATAVIVRRSRCHYMFFPVIIIVTFFFVSNRLLSVELSTGPFFAIITLE